MEDADAAVSDSTKLRGELLDRSNTASDVCNETAYRSEAHEDFIEN